MSMNDLLTGTVLGGYRLGRIISQGDSTVVHLAWDEAGARDVAVRVLLLDSIGDEHDVQRFAHDSALAASIEHPHIIRTLGSGRAHGVLWTATDLAAGECLRQRLQDQERLSVTETIATVRQLLSALAAAHAQDILHRDIRADNIMIADDGSVKVLGFGITTVPSEPILSRPDDIVGSVEYLAPEQILGDPVGPAADLYAVGVLLYELLTGTLPFTAPSPAALIYRQLIEEPAAPSQLQPGIPRALDRLVLRLLNKLPEERADAATALRQLDALGLHQDLTTWTQAPVSAAESAAAQQRARSFQPAFVGREDDMQALVSHLEPLAGGGHTVLVAGEAGVGKTRLTAEFRHRVEAAGIHCLSGSCVFDNSLGPYMPFMDILGELFNLPDEALSPHVRQALIEQLQDQDPELAALARSSTTTAKVRSSFTAALGAENGGDAARLRFFDAILEVLETVARSRPLVLILEDVHWADDGSLNLLSHIIQRLADAPILVLVTYRPEEANANSDLVSLLSRLAAEDGVHRLGLERLNRTALVELTASLFVDADFDADFGDYLCAQSQGNPFIAMEILKLLRSENVLFKQNGLWQVDPGFSGQVLPERVSALVLRRVELLANPERELLQLAAVIGQRFTLATLEAAAGTPRIALLKQLFRLERQHRLVTCADGMYEFTHSKIREVLYEETPWELRREYHSSVAGILGRMGDEIDDAELGHHLFRSERFAEALPRLEHAAANARRLFSWREAALLFDQAAEACLQSNGEVSRLLRALRAAGRCYANLTAYDVATQRMTRMQAVAVTAQRPTEEADAVVQMGRIDLSCGRYSDATMAFAHAIDLVGQQQDPGARAVYGQAVLNWGVADFQSGRYAEAADHWEQARQTLLDDPAELASCLNNLAVLATVRGELEEASRLYEQVLKLDLERQDLEQMALTCLNMAMIQADQERWDEALDLSARSLELCRQSRLRAHEPNIQLSRAEALLGKGDADAQLALSAAMQGFRRLDDALGIADTLRLQGHLFRQQQRWDEGRDVLRRSIDINRQFGASVSLGEALRELAELQIAAGESGDAITLLQEAESIFVQAEARLDLDRVRRVLDELHVS
ncbi:MAG: AAA family ATPase [bacterium]|nr:AAA family ATPase [bacterium]